MTNVIDRTTQYQLETSGYDQGASLEVRNNVHRILFDLRATDSGGSHLVRADGECIDIFSFRTSTDPFERFESIVQGIKAIVDNARIKLREKSIAKVPDGLSEEQLLELPFDVKVLREMSN